MKALNIKTPQQERSLAKFSALLEATPRVLREQGFKQCTTAKIALEADVSIGSFYDYFSCKKAVIIAYLDEQLNQALQQVQQKAQVKMQNSKTLLEEFVRAGVDFAFDEADIIKTVAIHFPLEMQLINFEKSKIQLQEIAIEFVRNNTLNKQKVLVNKDPELVLYSLTNLLLGFQFRIVFMPEAKFSRELISKEITEMIHDYLF